MLTPCYLFEGKTNRPSGLPLGTRKHAHDVQNQALCSLRPSAASLNPTIAVNADEKTLQLSPLSRGGVRPKQPRCPSIIQKTAAPHQTLALPPAECLHLPPYLRSRDRSGSSGASFLPRTCQVALHAHTAARERSCVIYFTSNNIREGRHK